MDTGQTHDNILHSEARCDFNAIHLFAEEEHTGDTDVIVFIFSIQVPFLLSVQTVRTKN